MFSYIESFQIINKTATNSFNQNVGLFYT